MRHADAIQRLATDPLILETTALPSPYPADGARVWIEQMLEPRRRAGREFAYAIIREDRTLVGVCGFNNVPDDKERVEIGYWVGVPFWGKGYATQAIRQLVGIGFTGLGFQSLYAPILQRNRASQRVVGKLGFHHSRTYHNTLYPKWPEQEILVEYTLNRTEWSTSAPNPLQPT